MTSTPLPQMPEPYQEILTPFWAYTADQMQAYAQQARADLEAEVRRLREALRIAINQNEHDMLMTGEELRQARAALESKP